MISNKENSFLLVQFEKPYCDFIFNMIKTQGLNNDDKLLNNVEKILPVSKLLKGRENKKISKISYEYNKKALIFSLYF